MTLAFRQIPPEFVAGRGWMGVDVGIVVIGRNEGERLIGCLNALRELGPLANRIVYVDSGSNDGSPEAASRMGAVVVRLSTERPFSAARARNEGFTALRRLAPGLKFVQFIDGDCTLNPSWISKSLEFMEARSDVAIVCGRRREQNPRESVYNELCDIEWDAEQGAVTSCGGDFLVRTTAFDEISGFNAALIAGEEPEMCLRLRERGWYIWRLPTEMTIHDAAISRFYQWWRRTERCGYGSMQVAWMHRRSRSCAEKRSVVSAVLWGGILPAAICLGAIIQPLILLFSLIYLAQMCRIAIVRGPLKRRSWLYAGFVIIAKIGETKGIAMLASDLLRTRSESTGNFDYKRLNRRYH